MIGDPGRVVKPTGHLGIISVYPEKDLHPAPEGRPDGHLTVPGTTRFSNGVSLGFGRTYDDRLYRVLLRDLGLSARARPSLVVTHHGGLEDAPGLYRASDQRADGVINAVLHP